MTSHGRTCARLTMGVAALVAVSASIVGSVQPASAVDPTIQISISQQTGIGPFDGDNAAGHDSSDANDIIRTNDTIRYKFEVHYEPGDAQAPSTGTTVTVDLPKGTYLDGINSAVMCDPATSSLTPNTIPAPTMPLTATSWQSLPSQKLVCNLKNDPPNSSTTSYPISVRVLGWVPNGTVLGPVRPSVTNDAVSAPVGSANQVQATVSAAPRWEMSANGTALQEDAGFVFAERRRCAFDAARACMIHTYPILLSAPAGGKGTTPLTGPITLTDDVTPSSLWPNADGQTDPAPDGITDLDTYGARLVGCTDRANYAYIPGGRIGEALPVGSGTEVNSVRDSGTTRCAQPGGAGTPITVTIDNADTSLLTFPSQVAYPAGNTLPGDAAYAVSTTIGIEFPIDTITEYGVPQGARTTLTTHHALRDLRVAALDGTIQPAGVDQDWNNYRNTQPFVEPVGKVGLNFAGVPGARGNTQENAYNPGFAIWEGPPGDFPLQSGSIVAAPTQEVISMMQFIGGAFGEPPISAIGCASWDPTQLQLMRGAVPASTSTNASKYTAVFPSNGDAAWLSGTNVPGAGNINPVAPHKIQYSDGGGTNASTNCSTGNWYDDPADVPGNDLSLAALGIYTAASRVRAWVEVPPAEAEGRGYVFISIHQRVAPDLAKGTKIGNLGGALINGSASQPMDDMLTNPALGWYLSPYDPATHQGELGDRLIAGPSYSRITDWIKPAGATDFRLGSSTAQQVAGADTISYRLDPTLNSAAAGAPQTAVFVENCLPAGQSLIEATPTPQVVAQAPPAGAGLQCDAKETYIKWDLGDQVPNQPISPIHLQVQVSPTVSATPTYSNETLVTSGDENNDDALDKARRTATATVKVVQSEGIFIERSALTPYAQVNRTSEATKDPLRWQIQMVNQNAPGQLTNPDMIDLFPAVGIRGTDFDGQLEFVSADDPANDPDLKIWFTKNTDFVTAANAWMDPSDPANAPGGTTVWCDAPTGGVVVSGAGTAADCPSNASQVTGLRIKKGSIANPIPFNSNDVLTVNVTMMPTDNRAMDLYNNCMSGRVRGLINTVGPVCARETIQGSTIGDKAWVDANQDGIQDAGEAPYPNMDVHLQGTDSDGNTVSLDTTTDEHGEYSFDNLQSGDYAVRFSPATPFTTWQSFTLQDHDADPSSDAEDSDGDLITGVTKAYALGVDKQILTVDQGVVQTNPEIKIVTFINGDDADAKPGVAVNEDSTMDVTFDVENAGEVRLDPVVVTDDTIKTADISCPKTALAAGEKMTCTATHAAPEPGIQHTNIATVEGTPPALPGSPTPEKVTDSNPANAHVATAPAITIVKYINDHDANTAPGVKVPAGSTMQIKYVVTNSGDVKLDPVVVTDDKIAGADIKCPEAALSAGESMACTAIFPAPAAGVQHTTAGTVVGTTPGGTTVTDEDPANAIVKLVATVSGESPNGTVVTDDNEANANVVKANVAGVTVHAASPSGARAPGLLPNTGASRSVLGALLLSLGLLGLGVLTIRRPRRNHP